MLEDDDDEEGMEVMEEIQEEDYTEVTTGFESGTGESEEDVLDLVNDNE